MSQTADSNGEQMNGLDPAADDSDCPPLVSSDEDEADCPTKSNEVMEKWMQHTKDDPGWTEKEVKRIKQQGVGIFLLGLGKFFDDVWVSALVDAKTVPTGDRTSSLDEMNEKYMMMIKIIINIFDHNLDIFFKFLAKQGRWAEMVEILNMINLMEEKFINNKKLCVEICLRAAQGFRFYGTECRRLKQLAIFKRYTKLFEEGCPDAVDFAVIFFCKIVHAHVYYFASHKGTLTDKIVREMINSDALDHVKAKQSGNELVKLGKYKEAIKIYTAAMKKDYANCYLYSNRAQCYISLKEYMKAYSDCRRAIFLEPAWYKSYYRAAEACLGLGNRWEDALDYNEKSQSALESSACPDKDLLSSIEEQRKKIEIQKQKEIAKENSLFGRTSYYRKELQAAMQGDSSACTCSPEMKSLRAEKYRLAKKDECICSPGLKQLNAELDKHRIRAINAELAAARENKGKTKADGDAARTVSSTQQSVNGGGEGDGEKDKLSLYLREGVEAYNLDNMVRASGKYQAALNLCNQHMTLKSWMGSEGIMVLRYAFAITAVSSDNMRSVIQEGLHTFQSMHRDELHQIFPLLLYGLGRALLAFYRYSQAKSVVNTTLTKAMRKALKPVCWPQSSQVIPESNKDNFLREMERLKALCRYPPQPDAVCSHHVDTEEDRAVYTISPTYGGLVSMSCYLKCQFRFHIACWKAYKTKFSPDKISDKEVMDKACPTPNCGSFITYICISKPGKKMVEFSSDNHPPRPQTAHRPVKMKPSSQYTIARRLERKEIRRQKKAEARQRANPQWASGVQNGLTEDSNLSEGEKENQNGEDTVPTMSTSNNMVILNKDGSDDMKYNTFQKVVRQKKKKEKKEKGQTVMNVEVNFTDNAERERVGGYDLEGEVGEEADFWYNQPKYTTQPVYTAEPVYREAAPPAVKRPVESFSQAVTNTTSLNPSLSQKDEDIKKTLTLEPCDFRLLHDILREEGPQRLNDILQRGVFQDIPEETNRIIQQYGGLRLYFEKNYEFCVRGEFVGIRSDLDKVQRLADSVSPPSPWMGNYALNSDPYNSNLTLLGCATTRTNIWQTDTVTDINGQENGVGKVTVASFSDKSSVMTLPIIEHGLNPTAPEFQPSHNKRSMNDIDDIELGSYSEVATSDTVNTNGLDALDTFNTHGYDSDIEEATSMNKNTRLLDVNDIDEVDLGPSASESYTPMEDSSARKSVDEGLSRRSSQSDLSQSGSDFSTGVLYRTASPSSSVSSHRNNSTRDVGSPFSMRDLNSPGLSQRVGDLTRQTLSPSLSPSIVATETTDGASAEVSFGSSFGSSVASSTSSFAGTKMGENTPPGFPAPVGSTSVTSGFPKPLKPLAPIGGAARLMGNLGSSMKSVGSVSTSSAGNDNVTAASVNPETSTAVSDIVHDSSSTSISSSLMTGMMSSLSSSLITGSSLSSFSKEFTPTYGSGLANEMRIPLFSHVPEYTPTSSFNVGLSSSASTTVGESFVPSLSLGPSLSSLPGSLLSSKTSVNEQTTLSVASTFSSSLSSFSPLSSSDVSISSSLPVSSVLVKEFVPSSSLLSYTSSSSSLLPDSYSSSSLTLPSSSPWGEVTSGSGSDTWSNNTFPSSIRPNESIIPFLPPPDTTVPPPSPSSSTTFPPSWSTAGEGGDAGRGWMGVRKSVDAEVQVGSGVGTEVGVSTELSMRDVEVLELNRDSLNAVHMQKMQLIQQVEQLQKEKQETEEERQASKREVEELRNDLKKAVQQMSNMEIDHARMKEELGIREKQLMADLQTQQQKSHLSSMETNSLLQKCSGLEDKFAQEKRRATQAEVRVVQEQMENFKLMFGSKIAEVEHRIQEFRICVINWQRSNPGQTPPDHQVKEGMNYYSQVKDAFTNARDSVMNQLKDLQDQILGGKTLSELDPVSNLVPQLPKQPDCLKTGSSGQTIFSPISTDSFNPSPAASVAESTLDSTVPAAPVSAPTTRMAGGVPPGLSHQPPTPLRPPLGVSRPPGMGGTTLAAIAALSKPQQPTPPTTTTTAAAAFKSAPQPLRPIGSGKGMMGNVQRAAPPLATGRGDLSSQPASSVSSKNQSSFDRLVSCLQKNFPSCDRDIFQQCVQELRRARNGSLSGLSLDYIVRHVTQMLIARGYRPNGVSMMNANSNNNTNTTHNNGSTSKQWETKRTAPPPGLSAAWSVEGLEPVNSDSYVEEEDPCVICTDELSSAPVQMLDCTHRFHDHCIRKWFRQQTTCPKCRSHAPLQDDFPVLK